VLRQLIAGGTWQSYVLADFAAIHASPPCQLYSALRNAAADRGSGHPDLVAPTRELLEESGLPWVMENVPGAPMTPAIVLCGSMFGLGAGDRQLRRHRLFESNVAMMQTSCQHRGEAIGVYGGGRTGRYTFGNGAHRDKYKRRGAYQGTHAEAREAMGIDWMRHGELTQAIPPAYTEHIGGYLMAALQPAERAA
jgi:DNA (cytosine-5)-methyltransferase 1